MPSRPFAIEPTTEREQPGIAAMIAAIPHPHAVSAEMTRDDARRHAAGWLAKVSGHEAALDARILLEDATGLDRTALLRDGDRPLGTVAATRLQATIARRQAGEPVWRILGWREFWGLPFTVTPAVLDPRPDTETLVSAALGALAARRSEDLRILDLGTGSGAVICALLHELPHARGVAVDRSLEACRVARGNVEALGFGARGLVVNGDWGRALAPRAFDLVVSNPPYIETAAIPHLDREVRDHDPHQALDGGSDGLECYRAIAADLPRLLKLGGFVALEVGAGQAEAVMVLLADAGLTGRTSHADLGGHLRVVTAGRA